MDKELFRNGSGYADPTAYKAFMNIERDEKMDFERGEIYEYEETKKGTHKKALILSADFKKNNRWQNVLFLNEEPKGQINVPIACEGLMYADCGFVSLAISENFGRFIRKAREEEMAQIDEGVAKCLGLEQKVAKEFIDEVTLQAMVLPTEEPSEELATAKAEAKIYKDLYEKLLAKVMG